MICLYLLQGANTFLIESKIAEISRGEIIRLSGPVSEVDFRDALFQEGFDDVERTVIVWGEEAIKKLGSVRVAESLHKKASHVRVIVVFDDRPERVPKKNSLVSAIKKSGQTFVYKPLYDEQALVDWIVRRSSELGLSVDSAAADTLFRVLGTLEQSHINQELVKLSIAFIERGSVSVADIQRFCSYIGEDELFDFCEQVGMRSLARSSDIWCLLDKNTGNAVLSIKGALRAHLLKLLMCLDHSGLSDEELSDLIGAKYVFLFKQAGWRQQAKKWGRDELLSAIRYLNDIPVQESKRQLELKLRRFMIQYMQ